MINDNLNLSVLINLIPGTGGTSKITTYLNLALINDVEVVPFVALLNDRLAGKKVDREHGVEDIAALVLIQMSEQDVFTDRFGQGGHRFVIFGHHLCVCVCVCASGQTIQKQTKMLFKLI